jgi:hypothetical protein
MYVYYSRRLVPRVVVISRPLRVMGTSMFTWTTNSFLVSGWEREGKQLYRQQFGK